MKDWKKMKNNKPPRFPPFTYKGEFRNGVLVPVATYKLIKVEA